MICLHPLNYVLEWEICFLCVCLSVGTYKILSFFPWYTQMYFCFISAWLPKNNNNAMFSMVYVVFPFFLYIRWVGDTSRVRLQQTGGAIHPSSRTVTCFLIYLSAVLYVDWNISFVREYMPKGEWMEDDDNMRVFAEILSC